MMSIMKNFMKSMVCLLMLVGCVPVDTAPPVVEPRCICVDGMVDDCPACYTDKDHGHAHDNHDAHDGHHDDDNDDDNGWNYIPIPDYSPTPDDV